MSVVISDDPAERWRAYTESQIRIWRSTGPIVIAPEVDGSVTGAFPEASDTTIHVVTGQNPGRQLTDEENIARHVRLWDRLQQNQGLHVDLAEGGDEGWFHAEASFAVMGLTDAEAVQLGREFDQEAVFAWRSDELVVLNCNEGESVSLGWSVR